MSNSTDEIMHRSNNITNGNQSGWIFFNNLGHPSMHVARTVQYFEKKLFAQNVNIR